MRLENITEFTSSFIELMHFPSPDSVGVWSLRPGVQTQHECGRSQGHCACLGQLQLLQRQSQVCSVCTTTRPCHEVQFKSQTVGAGFQTVCELFICQVYCQTLIPFLKTRGVFVSLLLGGNTCCYISLQGSRPDSSPQLLILALVLTCLRVFRREGELSLVGRTLTVRSNHFLISFPSLVTHSFVRLLKLSALLF